MYIKVKKNKNQIISQVHIAKSIFMSSSYEFSASRRGHEKYIVIRLLFIVTPPFTPTVYLPPI